MGPENHYKHKIIGKDKTQLLLLIEPESIYGENIGNYLKNAKYYFFTLNKIINNEINSNINSKAFDVYSIIKILFKYLDIDIIKKSKIDNRINKVISIIENTSEKKSDQD